MLYPYFLGLVISANQRATLDDLARQRGVSKSEIVRRLIDTQAPVSLGDEEEDVTGDDHAVA